MHKKSSEMLQRGILNRNLPFSIGYTLNNNYPKRYFVKKEKTSEKIF